MQVADSWADETRWNVSNRTHGVSLDTRSHDAASPRVRFKLMVLTYRSCEEIKTGDHVLFHCNAATVEFVAVDAADPGAEWYLQNFGGGVMISDPSVSGRTFIAVSQIDEYEDVELVSRAQE